MTVVGKFLSSECSSLSGYLPTDQIFTVEDIKHDL